MATDMTAVEMMKLAGQCSLNAVETIINEEGTPDGGIIRELNIEIDVLPGKRVTLYGFYGMPASVTSSTGAKPCPTVLHIHGGGQTAFVEHVRRWVQKGCICCSYDWTGPYANRTKYSLIHNFPAGDMTACFTPGDSVLLTRVMVARTVLSWLCSRPEVDTDRIAAYGLSWGGTIAWLLNSYDDRLKAAAMIYGCGNHNNPGRCYERGAQRTDLQNERWRRVLDPSYHAQHQKSPVLFLNATNDFWGWMDAACQSLANVPDGQFSTYFRANHDHTIGSRGLPTLDNFMDYHLKNAGCWPENPDISVNFDGVNMHAVIHAGYVATADKNNDVEAVKVLYSIGSLTDVPSPNRAWDMLHATPITAGNAGASASASAADTTTAAAADVTAADATTATGIACKTFDCILPVYYPNDYIMIYADVYYKNGTKLSSLPLIFVPSYFGCGKTAEFNPDNISDFAGDFNGWTCKLRYADIIICKTFSYKITEGPHGSRAITMQKVKGLPVFDLATDRLSDKRWKTYDASKLLSLYLKADCDNRTATISLVENASRLGEKIWKAQVTAGTEWKEFTFGAVDFKSDNGEPLDNWARAGRLNVRMEWPDTTTGAKTNASTSASGGGSESSDNDGVSGSVPATKPVTESATEPTPEPAIGPAIGPVKWVRQSA